jgi:glycosyltransferase involved in cell wall biosynthesis
MTAAREAKETSDLFGTATRPPTDLSIVVPLYNEVGNVEPLHQAVTDALAGQPWRYELVLVDDGSRDATLARAIALVARDPRVRVIALRRNFGQTAAMAAGIQSARGAIIVTMDGDLQNDPRDIAELVTLVADGHDLVAGWRRKRRDGGARVAISKVANHIINMVLGVQVRDTGCSLKAYRAELIQALPFYGEMHRFIPALSQLTGSRTVQVEVRHHPRLTGVSKYGFSRIYKVMLDIVSIRFLLTYARHPVVATAWPAGVTAMAGVTALGVYAASSSVSLVFASAGILFLTTAGFMVALGFLGLVFAAKHARMQDLATVGARMWRNTADGSEQSA